MFILFCLQEVNCTAKRPTVRSVVTTMEEVFSHKYPESEFEILHASSFKQLETSVKLEVVSVGKQTADSAGRD